MNIEELFENLETLEAAALIRLADSTDILAGQENYDLIMLIQELAGRLEDVLNLDVMGAEEGEETESPIHEYN
jgi:hypothetical protein